MKKLISILILTTIILPAINFVERHNNVLSPSFNFKNSPVMIALLTIFSFSISIIFGFPVEPDVLIFIELSSLVHSRIKLYKEISQSEILSF